MRLQRGGCSGRDSIHLLARSVAEVLRAPEAWPIEERDGTVRSARGGDVVGGDPVRGVRGAGVPTVGAVARAGATVRNTGVGRP